MPRPNSGSRVHAPLTFDDLVGDLVWPKLLRAGHLALRPSRLGMAFVFVIGVLLLGSLANRKDEHGDAHNLLVETFVTFVLDVRVMAQGSAPPGQRIGHEVFAMLGSTPAYLVRTSPFVAFVLLPLLALWTAIWGGAISRSAACEFSQGVGLEWPKALGFALSRWVSLAMALVGPFLIVWAILLAMAVAGGVVFSLPGVNLLGAALWPLFLIGGVIAAVIMLAYLFAWPMLLPSVACEGTDAVDAVQHAYSFVFARPLRLVVYTLVLIVQGVIVTGVVAVAMWLAVHIAQKCGMAWSGTRGAEALGHLPGHEISGAPNAEGGAIVLARGIANLWTIVLVVLPIAFVVSFAWSGSTILYLAMRKVVDGQDVHEIWMPGMVEGTMAAEGKGGGGKAEGGSGKMSGAAASGGDGVVDDGPADET